MANYRLLQETGEFLLQETTDKILLDGYTYTEVTKSLQYVVQSTITVKVDKDLTYTVKITQSPVEKTLIYTVSQAPTAIGKSLKYTVVSPVAAIEKGLVYMIVSPVTAITKDLKYTVIVSKPTITKSLKYCIVSTPNKLFTYRLQQEDDFYILQEDGFKITLDGIGNGEKYLRYRIVLTKSQTKSLTYSVLISPAITKTLTYSVVFQTKSIGLRLSYHIIKNNEDVELYHRHNTIFTNQYASKGTIYANQYPAKGTTYTYKYKVEETHGIVKSLTYTIG